jgi:chemotaxis signal transduction protein
MSEREHLVARAGRLRADFDSMFAAPPPEPTPPQVDLLAIRCAEHGFALRLAQVVSVHTERKVVPVPTPVPELLGLAGVRGLVVPVYDLGALLGQAPNAAPRWLALVRAPAPFAVGFELFERHLRVPTADLVTTSHEGAVAHGFGGGSVRTSSGPRPLLDLLAVFEAVMGRLRTAPEREDPK